MSCTKTLGTTLWNRVDAAGLVLSSSASEPYGFRSTAGTWTLSGSQDGQAIAYVPASQPVAVDAIRVAISSGGYIGGGALQWSGTMNGVPSQRPFAVNTFADFMGADARPRPLTDPKHIAGSADAPTNHCEWDLIKD